jgi:hypothetical protein
MPARPPVSPWQSRRHEGPLLNLLDICFPVYEQWASFNGLAHGGTGRRESSIESFDSSKDCCPLDWLRGHVEPEGRGSSELLIQAREIRFNRSRGRRHVP